MIARKKLYDNVGASQLLLFTQKMFRRLVISLILTYSTVINVPPFLVIIQIVLFVAIEVIANIFVNLKNDLKLTCVFHLISQ